MKLETRQGPVHMGLYRYPQKSGNKEEGHDKICMLKAHSGCSVQDRLHKGTGEDRRR